MLALRSSKDLLFFIQYTPSDTMRPRWYLVQVERGEFLSAPKDNLFHYTFLNRHPSDAVKSDNKARRWPEWREITCNKDNTFEYGTRVLLSPRAKPDQERFSKFGTYISFTANGTVLVGPFDFDTPTPLLRVQLG